MTFLSNFCFCIFFLAEEELAPAGDERALFWFEVGVNLVWLVGFSALWIVRRLALADLLLTDRRSALLASLRAWWLLLRRPLRLAAAYGTLFVLFALLIGAAGLALEWLVASDRLPLAFLVGLAALVLGQMFLAASFVVARRLWELERAMAAGGEKPSPGDDIVVMPVAVAGPSDP